MTDLLHDTSSGRIQESVGLTSSNSLLGDSADSRESAALTFSVSLLGDPADSSDTELARQPVRSQQ